MILTYHRPASLDEALRLLARPDIASTPLAGGTLVNAHQVADEVVDLQSLGLDRIEPGEGSLRIGAMARLQDLVDDPLVPHGLAELAHREAPSTTRNAATVGGTIAAGEADSELIAGLLAYGATVTLAGLGGTEDVPLQALLDPGFEFGARLMTTVVLRTAGTMAAARTGRTPADRSIVAVIGLRTQSGSTRFAATGVGPTPLLIDPDSLESLEPIGDFLGSSDYRRHLVATLVTRVGDRLDEGAGS